ncbi:MAG: nucleotide exchange factor GrpE [Actinomycetota bacterium]
MTDNTIGAPDDGTERASEIDDITSSMPRPTPGAAPAAPPSHTAGTGDGDIADVDDLDEFDAVAPDFSDVDVEALLTEREEYRAMAQRVQADFDNYRRRMQTQAQADADRATGRLAEALLPVLDAAEAAYLRHPDEVGPLLNQMLVELKKQGLELVNLDGAPFDPEVAEAVAHEPAGGGEPTVAEVLRSGYLWKGKVLRAAMVKTTD